MNRRVERVHHVNRLLTHGKARWIDAQRPKQANAGLLEEGAASELVDALEAVAQMLHKFEL